MADNRAAPTESAPGTRRHAGDVERRRCHPGEPRRPVTADRPTPHDDRRGAHAWAGSRSR
jgi:hypothetical protein